MDGHCAGAGVEDGTVVGKKGTSVSDVVSCKVLVLVC